MPFAAPVAMVAADRPDRAATGNSWPNAKCGPWAPASATPQVQEAPKAGLPSFLGLLRDLDLAKLNRNRSPAHRRNAGYRPQFSIAARRAARPRAVMV